MFFAAAATISLSFSSSLWCRARFLRHRRRLTLAGYLAHSSFLFYSLVSTHRRRSRSFLSLSMPCTCICLYATHPADSNPTLIHPPLPQSTPTRTRAHLHLVPVRPSSRASYLAKCRCRARSLRIHPLSESLSALLDLGLVWSHSWESADEMQLPYSDSLESESYACPHADTIEAFKFHRTARVRVMHEPARGCVSIPACFMIYRSKLELVELEIENLI